MKTSEEVEILRQGPESWNKWWADYLESYQNDPESDLDQHGELRAQLAGADLQGAGLWGVNLKHANLAGANLENARLSGADLSGALLIGARLRGACLDNVNLQRANLERADLRDSSLFGTDFMGANLEKADFAKAQLFATNLSRAALFEADFSEARFAQTVIVETDLRHAKGLSTVHHGGPSSIGVDTLYASGGIIPYEFLSGAGIQEEHIEKLLPLIRASSGTRRSSCFISHSTSDVEFSNHLHAKLIGSNFRVWFAPEDLQGGKKLQEQIFAAIQSFDRLLLVLSEASMKSEWVKSEIRKARELERRQKTRKLFPIRLVDFDALRNWSCFDGDTGSDLAVEVREYFIPDFSKWQNDDAFSEAFGSLLDDLSTS